MPQARICKSCKWVHFGLTRKECENAVKDFNEFYNYSTKEIQDCYGAPASLDNYTQCFRCGGSHKNFRDAEAEEVPYGSTIQPIMVEAEEA